MRSYHPVKFAKILIFLLFTLKNSNFRKFCWVIRTQLEAYWVWGYIIKSYITCFPLTVFWVHNRIYSYIDYRQTAVQTNKQISRNSGLDISIKPIYNWVPLYKGPKHIGSEAILWHLTSRAFLSRPLEAAVAESRKPTRPTFGTRGREPRSRPAMNRGRAAKGQEGQQLTPAGTPNGRRHPRWRCCRYVKFQPVNAPQNAV